jgi:signal transduction histidine kinase
MLVPPIPNNETLRIRALKDYSILDTLPEKEYDDITQLASQICGTPISLIGLIDENRQWYKSKYGIDGDESPRDVTFCGHAIINPNEIMTVKDSRLDQRFFDNPNVLGEPKVVFYAGIPLVSPDGYALGTLCVVDHKPKELSSRQIKALKALSNQVVSLFELRKTKMLLEKSANDLKIKNQELEVFANVAAHDIKSPLNNITSITEILLSDFSDNLTEDAKMFVGMLHSCSETLRNLVDGILKHSKTEFILNEAREVISLRPAIDEIRSLLDVKNQYQFIDNFNDCDVYINKVAFQQIMLNLMANSIKYNNKEQVVIEVGFSENSDFYQFYIKDNGAGIRREDMQKMFNIFEVLTAEDRFGNRGNGIGLSTVKKLVEGLGGQIGVESQIGKGTKISFTLAKSSFI